MNSLVHADIFFFVTTIAVVAVAIVFIILLLYAILSIRTLFRISKKIENETDAVISDINELRFGLKKRRAHIRNVTRVATRFFRKLFRRDSLN